MLCGCACNYRNELKGLSVNVNGSRLVGRNKPLPHTRDSSTPPSRDLRQGIPHDALYPLSKVRGEKLRPFSRSMFLEYLGSGASSTASAACSWKRAT